MIRPPPTSTLFPYTTLFRSVRQPGVRVTADEHRRDLRELFDIRTHLLRPERAVDAHAQQRHVRDGVTERSEEHTSELQSHHDLVCRLLLEKKKKNNK